jgi:L,D-peptidoglycan transpeptidase YkuD (ErfK/YbiS/YcfS/YnhG family)
MHERLASKPASLDHLDRGVFQAVTVRPSGPGPAAVLDAWERRGGCWDKVLTAAAVVGRGGFVAAEAKREGDGGTPHGVYALGHVFGYAAKGVTAMPYRQITAEDHWVDDPASPQYNQWVRGAPQAASWEDMLRPDGLYRHGIIVEHNTRPVVPGKGSAIFVHLWRGPGEATSGCVALGEAELLRIIAWLEPDKRPAIVLGKG